MGRHLVIGDIHGCITALESLLNAVALSDDDTIITLGDYVDRGPGASAVVDLIIDLDETHHLVPLRGNHEIMMLEARQKKSWLEPWLQYGGEETLQSYGGSFDDVPETHLEFLETRLVRCHETDTHIFVHANVDSDKPLDQQSDAALFWRKYRGPVEHCSGKIMICGHTAQFSGLPAVDSHSICIDTCPSGGGWLTCLEIETGSVWQANELGRSRRFTLNDMPS